VGDMAEGFSRIQSRYDGVPMDFYPDSRRERWENASDVWEQVPKEEINRRRSQLAHQGKLAEGERAKAWRVRRSAG